MKGSGGMPSRKTPKRDVAKTSRKSAATGKVENSATEFEQLLKQSTEGQRFVLRLFVTGSTARSAQAIENIHALCEDYLHGRYELEVIDIYQQPNAAAEEQIIAAPTLVKELPEPAQRLIGDLSDRGRVLVGLKLVNAKDAASLPEAPKTKWLKL
jgi:circadian clock protein KaiB